VSCRRYVNAETHLSIRLNAGTTSINGTAHIIHTRPVFSITIQPTIQTEWNTNRIFGTALPNSILSERLSVCLVSYRLRAPNLETEGTESQNWHQHF